MYSIVCLVHPHCFTIVRQCSALRTSGERKKFLCNSAIKGTYLNVKEGVKSFHISKQGQPDMHSHCLCVYFLPTSFLSFISFRRWKSAQREKRRERGDEGSVFPNLREVAGHKVHTKFIYLNTKIDQTKRKKVELFQLLIGILPFLSSLASSFSQKTPCVTMLKSFALAKVLKNIYTAFHLSTLMWLRAACSVL